MIRIKSDKIITRDGLFDGFVYLDGERIVDLSDKATDADLCYDFTGDYLSPGFIDIHTHGGGGYAFADSTADEVLSGCEFHLGFGTTTIVPTVSASEFDAMKASLESIRRAKNDPRRRVNILGAHLEGPYLSPEQCGGQCLSSITPPIREQYESLALEYADSLCRWSYAPENDKGGEFCDFLRKRGIVASAGHTNAKYSDMCLAIDKGCNLVTHLYSCTSTVTRDHGFRSLGVIETAFLRDELYVEIIADGKHLPPELIKMIIKIKGKEKVALITDSLSVAGSSQTSGNSCGTDFIVEDGVAKLPDRSAFAGSVATADVLVRTLIRDCGFDICDSVYMLSAVPAKIMGVNKGEISAGKDADLIVFDPEVRVSDAFVGGKKVI